MDIPDFIVHYSRSEPFRSLSAVSSEQFPEVIKELDETTAWGLRRFSDPEYLKRRVEVELRLRNGFIAKGGNPTIRHPIYFFLGRNARFEEHAGNKGYVIRIRDAPLDAVSFTYGDSMFSLNEDYRHLKGEGYLSDLCPHVYRLEELPGIFSHPDYRSPSRLHIEAQMWITPTDAMITRG